MPSNKVRLYVGLYERWGEQRRPNREDRYHWALITGPKNDIVTSKVPSFGVHQVKERLVQRPDSLILTPKWYYSHTLDDEGRVLVRVLVGKVKNLGRLHDVLDGVTPTSESEYCSVDWVHDALAALIQDRKTLSSRVSDWRLIRDTALLYVRAKTEARRLEFRGPINRDRPPTWDLLKNTELVD